MRYKLLYSAGLQDRDNIVIGKQTTGSRTPYIDSSAIGNKQIGIHPLQCSLYSLYRQAIIAGEKNRRIPIRISYSNQACFAGKGQKPQQGSHYTGRNVIEQTHLVTSSGFFATNSIKLSILFNLTDSMIKPDSSIFFGKSLTAWVVV